MNTQTNIQLEKSFLQRWICIAHVLPSPLYDETPPNGIGAFVPIVADAPSKDEFIAKVHDALENTMGFPIIELEGIEILLPDRNIGERLQDSIKNLLPYFPIAYDEFQFYDKTEDDEDAKCI